MGKIKSISGTKEWANQTINIANGCENDCHYCYAKSMAIRFKRNSSDNWKNPIIKESKIKKNYRSYEGVIMYPSSHDITPANLEESIQFIEKHLKVGNHLLIVSKPRIECISAICDKFQDYKDNILFRFTIGSANDDILRFWEPNAPLFNERLESLEYAFNYGYRTSVSCEPMLDDNIDDVINQVREYVTDSIWLGKVNRLRGILSQNGINDKEILNRADQWIKLQNDGAIKTLYEKYKDDSLIKWKESIKKVVGLELATEAGLNI